MTATLKTNSTVTSKKPLLFLLDYDGTLTDFKKDPNRSFLSPRARQVLVKLQKKHAVVIVTGRNLDRLYEVSGLKSFPAVGTHGFETRYLPRGLRFTSQAVEKKYRLEASAIWKRVKDLHLQYPGIHIEKKPFSSTLHYRGTNLSLKETQKLEWEYKRLCLQAITTKLWKFQSGKQMVELMPRGFSKANAVKKLLAYYPEHFPLFAGDDIGDIPTLGLVKKKGLAIAIGNRIPQSAQNLHFDKPRQLIAWLGTQL
jgi:trehalose 6-phosphate synthase/phosphatase